MKICSGCNLNKDTQNFYYKANQKDLLDYYCKDCRNASTLKSHRNQKQAKRCALTECAHPHYAQGFCRKHYERNRSGKPLNWRYTKKAGESLASRKYRLKTFYKLTLEEFELMAIDGCQICHGYDERNLHVDHDHSCCKGQISCGKCVRGVVCHRCNVELQKFDTGTMRPENPNKERVAKYVMRYRNRVNVRN